MINSFVKDRKINIGYFKLEKNFFYNFNKNHYHALKKIQVCKDFKFEDFLNQEEGVDGRKFYLRSNLLAKKSFFIYHQVHFYGNINLLKTNEKNILLFNELYSNYKNNIKTDLNKLNILDLVILIPTEKETLFSGNYQKIKINNEFILILINFEKENLLTQCLR